MIMHRGQVDIRLGGDRSERSGVDAMLSEEMLSDIEQVGFGICRLHTFLLVIYPIS
jgi:hypothetical protein